MVPKLAPLFLCRAVHPKPSGTASPALHTGGQPEPGEAPHWWPGHSHVWRYPGHDVRLSHLLSFSVRPVSEARLLSFSGPWCLRSSLQSHLHARECFHRDSLHPFPPPHTSVIPHSPHTFRSPGLGQTLTDEKWHVLSNLMHPTSWLTPGASGHLEWGAVRLRVVIWQRVR